MSRIIVAALAFTLLGSAEPLSTERHVAGVVTSVDASTLTIASAQHTVIGKVDAKRTRITVKGRPASLADVKLTAHARAELCLDDVWVSIDAH